MGAATKRVSNEELRRRVDDLPEDVTGEVIDGVLYTMGRPRVAHQYTSSNIGGDLGMGRFGGAPPPAGWLIVPDVEILFPTLESVVPDLSGWRRARARGHEDDNPMTVLPDWVCEIFSDSTKKKDLGPKRDLYARQGIKHLWLVDADERYAEAFSLNEQNRWVLLGTWSADATMDVAPFEGTPLKLENWWLPKGDSGG
jgi:Uma2 family endonuclease